MFLWMEDKGLHKTPLQGLPFPCNIFLAPLHSHEREQWSEEGTGSTSSCFSPQGLISPFLISQYKSLEFCTMAVRGRLTPKRPICGSFSLLSQLLHDCASTIVSCFTLGAHLGQDHPHHRHLSWWICSVLAMNHSTRLKGTQLSLYMLQNPAYMLHTLGYVLCHESMWRHLRTQKSDEIPIKVWQRESDLIPILCTPEQLHSKPYWSAFWPSIIQFLSNVDDEGKEPGPYTRS